MLLLAMAQYKNFSQTTDPPVIIGRMVSEVYMCMHVCLGMGMFYHFLILVLSLVVSSCDHSSHPGKVILVAQQGKRHHLP